MEEITFNYEHLPWVEAKGYPDGTQIKVLRDENGARTFLLKLPGGFKVESHSHLTTEQHFVLEGEYESGGHKYKKGTYRLIPAEATHGPFTSKHGATILVIWDPLKKHSENQ